MDKLTPETLRLLLAEFEVLRGKVLASGDIEDGTDSSIGVGLLLDDGYAHADAWAADKKRLEAAERRGERLAHVLSLVPDESRDRAWLEYGRQEE